MRSGSGRFALRTIAAAVGVAFALGANAQQTQAGLERATRTPLEIVWLKAEVWSEIRRDHARLVEARTCTPGANPREGCVIERRAPARFHFGPGTNVAPGSYFDLAGAGGVYLVLPEQGNRDLIRAPSGEVLLAAGKSVQLIHPAYPAIHVQVSAPANRPLALGNLAQAGTGTIFALLVKQPDAVNAAAAVADGGKVVLRSSSETRVAAGAAPAGRSTVAANAFALAFGPVDPASITLASFDAHAAVPRIDAARLLAQEFGAIDPASITLASIDEAVAGSGEPAPVSIDGAALAALAGSIETASAVPAVPGVAIADASAQAFGPVDPASVTLASLEMQTPGPLADGAWVIALDLGSTALGAEELAPQLSSDPVKLKTAQFVLVAAAANVPIPEIAPSRPSAPPGVTAQQSGGANPELARLRAEVEAEIARERERLAEAVQSCARTGSYRQGCTAGGPAPKRFVFAGA
ncbi:MAG: hypothetical protein A3D95_08900 [Betaproteobacteria bacterium RIFCSPHIGHO2_12_FULL_69_13]|nr:MAG: hypothetical protein A3D95_08900 [Betaproteobacteria bacterium RIFCSPHIGHO2_12_FULL_69_13]OGA68647.1 MAG: hypothetical protein A3G83_07205 [Betaproteobacteria bacterium RIFCSPLOWO2_12_FULL_68_20]